MVTTFETPIIDQMVSSLSNSDFSGALTSRLNRLIGLDYNEWIDQLIADGFGPQDVERLENLAAESIDVLHLENLLAKALQETYDIRNESELTAVIEEWSALIGWAGIWETVCRAGFPDPIDAIAHVTRTVFSITSSGLAYESIRRNSPGKTGLDFDPGPAAVEEGIDLAEWGIREDMDTWPAY